MSSVSNNSNSVTWSTFEGLVKGVVGALAILPARAVKIAVQTRSEGAFELKRAFDGGGILVSTLGPLTGIQVGIKETCAKLMDDPFARSMFAGLFAAALGGNQVDLTLTRRQLLSLEKVKKGSFEVAKEVFKEIGVLRATTRGLLVAGLRDGKFVWGFSVLNPFVVGWIDRRLPQIWKENHPWLAFAATYFAAPNISAMGVVAMTQPEDVLQARLHADYMGRKYTGTWDALRATLKNEGVKALWMGGAARTVMLACFFFATEMSSLALNKIREIS